LPQDICYWVIESIYRRIQFDEMGEFVFRDVLDGGMAILRGFFAVSSSMADATTCRFRVLIEGKGAALEDASAISMSLWGRIGAPISTIGFSRPAKSSAFSEA